MTLPKKGSREEMVRDIFIALAPKWDVKDKASARNLTRHCVEIVDGYYDAMDTAFAAKKPEKPG